MKKYLGKRPKAVKEWQRLGYKSKDDHSLNHQHDYNHNNHHDHNHNYNHTDDYNHNNNDEY